MFARADVHPARATATDLAQRTSSQPPPQALSPASDIPDDLAPRIKAAATRSGLRYESFTQQLLNCAFAHVGFWQQSDVERLFWLADRLGLDPLERDLIALEQKEPFPPSLGFMITLDGWVKLLHRHPRFRGLNFEEGPSDEHGLPLWVACSVFWEGFTCPWVVREWASEHRSLHESWLNYPRRMLRHKALTQCARLALGIGGGFWEVSGFDTPTYATASEHKSKSSSSDDKARRFTSQAALKRTIALQDELSQPLKAKEPNPAS
jgi:hypothetical protein